MFDLVGPCKDCPFRNDKIHQQGWLGADRARGIADSIEQGNVFPCHKTFDNSLEDDEEYDEDDNEIERTGFSLQPQNQFCAGALIMMEKEGTADRSRAVQIGERLGMYDRSKLRIDGSPVFNNANEFVEWHGR